MVDVYLEGLVPRVKSEFEKLGKPVPKRTARRLSDSELAKERATAEKEKKEAEEKEKSTSGAAEHVAAQEKEKIPKEDTTAPAGETNPKENAVKKAQKEKSEKIPKALLLKDGTKVRSLAELKSAVKEMHIDMFNLHLNFQKNDFADWVENELNNKNLASKMRKATSKKALLEIINGK